MCISLLRMRFVVLRLILRWVGGGLNLSPRRSEDDLYMEYKGMNVHYGQEIGHTLSNNLPKRFPIIRKFGHGFTIMPTLPRPIVNGQSKVMCGDGASHGGPERFDECHCRAGRCVFEDYAETGEGCVES